MALDDWDLWLDNAVDERTGTLTTREMKNVYNCLMKEAEVTLEERE